ncbi:phage tail tape measure protein [Faecalibacterium prausnitzii]
MTTELGALRARLLLEAENFKRGMQDARNEMQKTGQSAKKVSTDFDAMQGAVLAVAGGIAGGIGLAAKKAIDFEKQMSRVKAISGANTQEFKALEQAALDLGAQTSKSASEVAVAFEDMAARGFDANQIIAAMPGIISAAEASGSDLALTTDVVTAALNSFKLEASEANRIADIMAVTANESAASVEDLGYAFKYAAPIAKQLGISIEELAAATGIMVDAGLEGLNKSGPAVKKLAA